MRMDMKRSYLSDRTREKIQDFISEKGLFEPGELIIGAISGGVDSMVMMDALCELSPSIGFRLLIAHFDHGLRGPESALDAELVRAEAAKRGLPFFLGKGDVESFMENERHGLEEAARIMRYRFLFELKKCEKAHRIATAHHQDDQVETIIMRIMRGTGVKGLSGIRSTDPRGLTRPLLCLDKNEILEYARERSIAYRDDPTNRLPITLRNLIRNDLLAHVPDHEREILRKNIVTLSETALSVSRFLDDITEKVYTKSLQYSSTREIKLDLEKLKGYHYFLRAQVYRYSFRMLNDQHSDLSRNTTEVLTKFCEQCPSGRQMQLPGDVTVFRDFNSITFIRTQKNTIEAEHDPVTLRPGTDTIYSFGGSSFRVTVRQEEISDYERLKREVLDEGGKYLGCFDLDQLRLPLRLRGWVEGDRLHPFGLEGTKKVSDLLLETRIPRSRRGGVPVLMDREHILWVVGVRRSSHAIMNGKTRNVIIIQFSVEDIRGKVQYVQTRGNHRSARYKK